MLFSVLGIPAPTFSEFGLWYFVFGLFIALGFIMLGFILLADPDSQYDIDSIADVPANATSERFAEKAKS
jgi:hypothetical protein